MCIGHGCNCDYRCLLIKQKPGWIDFFSPWQNLSSPMVSILQESGRISMKYLDFWRGTNKYLILTNDFRHLQPIGCVHSANELIGFSPYSPLHQSDVVTVTDVLTRSQADTGTCTHGLQDEWASAALLWLLWALHVCCPKPSLVSVQSPAFCYPAFTLHLVLSLFTFMRFVYVGPNSEL